MKQAKKIFTRMCLNNWGGINHKILEFHEYVNLFSGKSGSGKSTVMDAIAERSARVTTALQAIDQVSRASAAQSQEVSAATQEQSASLEELAALSESLRKLAGAMEKSISVFRV